MKQEDLIYPNRFTELHNNETIFFCKRDYIIEEYNNLSKLNHNLILSEGSFSWWIGFLSNAENIYYNQRERFWHGDIFVFPEWKPLQYDWHPDCISINNKLICDRII